MNGELKTIAKVLLLAAILSGLGAGCAWSVGGGKAGTAMSQPTKGQELVDLKKARDQHAITEEEYQQQRNKILEK
jgi:hypothetical protein